MKAASQIPLVGGLSLTEFSARLAAGLPVQIGPFRAHISATPALVAKPLHSLYADYPLINDGGIYSFHAKLETRRSISRFYNRYARFSVDGQVPHEDMPASQSLAVLEWGINLVIAMRAHCYLMLHSAVVEIDGSAMLLPAAPGFGKSTLCAGLSLSGWRLLSDEFGLLRPGTADIVPAPRPIALKNESIDVIRDFSPDVVIGPRIFNTRKGTVAHVKPPTESVCCADKTAPVRWIIFPRWVQDASTRFTKVSKAEAFMMLATNAFNYELLGEQAFRTVSDIVDRSICYRFEYSNLGDAVAALTDFVRSDDV